VNRRRFLAFLGALGPGLALARAGMGAPAPVLLNAYHVGPGRYDVPILQYGRGIRIEIIEASTRGTLTIAVSRDGATWDDWTFAPGDSDDRAEPI
jgi:hypothetical protein